MADCFNFVGFDGVEYNFSSMPEEIYNYKHYLAFSKNNGVVVFWAFNSDLINITSDSQNIYVNKESPILIRTWIYSISENQWYSYGESVKTAIASKIVYSSDSLLLYKDSLISGNCFLDLSLLESNFYTLRPIVEEQNITPLDVFGEIFGILPVLMVVLISFIGIRKGISWVFSLLRRS